MFFISQFSFCYNKRASSSNQLGSCLLDGHCGHTPSCGKRLLLSLVTQSPQRSGTLMSIKTRQIKQQRAVA